MFYASSEEYLIDMLAKNEEIYEKSIVLFCFDMRERSRGTRKHKQKLRFRGTAIFRCSLGHVVNVYFI